MKGEAFPQPRPPERRKTHYEILGVVQGASVDEIKLAYRNLARTGHPDRGGDSENFQNINKAYEILGDPLQRQEYDRSITASGNVDGGMTSSEIIDTTISNSLVRLRSEQTRRKIEKDFKTVCSRMNTDRMWVVASSASRQKEAERLFGAYKKSYKDAGLAPDETFLRNTLRDEGFTLK